MTFENRSSKMSPWVLSLILGLASPLLVPLIVHAQTLEDSIDAELDAASKGLNPEGAPLNSSRPTTKKTTVEPTLDTDAAPTRASNDLPADPVVTTPVPKPKAVAEPKSDVSPEPDPGLKSDLEGDNSFDAPLNADTVAAPVKKSSPPKAAVAPKDDGSGELTLDGASPNEAAPHSPEPEPAIATDAAPDADSQAGPKASVEQKNNNENASRSQSASSDESFSGDEPNLSFEKRLHLMFKDDRTISDDKWSEMVGTHAEEVYSVQAGDTLWDISTTLFGDGMFWTKIWAENGTIENPHLISPGKSIHFIAGNEANGPSLSVSETAVLASNSTNNGSVISSGDKNLTTEIQTDAPVYGDQVGAVTQDSTDLDDQAIIPRPEIPVGKTPKAPSHLPDSFHNSRVHYQGTFDKSGLDAPVQKAQIAKATVIPSSYLSEGLPASVGHIDEVEVGERYASIGQNVFIQLKKEFGVGDRLNVLFVKGTIKDPHHGNLGPIVEVGGTVEIVERLSRAKNVYRAVVVYAINPIRTNSFLTEMPLPRVTVKSQGRRSNADVRIVGAEFDESRKLAGQGSIIYLDGGHRDGINDGDILAVQSRRGAHRENSAFPEYRKTIGLIKIVQSLENVSTAMIIENSDEIRIGDRTGGDLPVSARGITYETIEPLPDSPDRVAPGSSLGNDSADAPAPAAHKDVDID